MPGFQTKGLMVTLIVVIILDLSCMVRHGKAEFSFLQKRTAF